MVHNEDEGEDYEEKVRTDICFEGASMKIGQNNNNVKQKE